MKSKKVIINITAYVETKMIPDHSESKATATFFIHFIISMATYKLFVLVSLIEWKPATIFVTFDWNSLQRHYGEYVVVEMAPLRFKCLCVGIREAETTPKLSDRKVSPPLSKTRVRPVNWK